MSEAPQLDDLAQVAIFQGAAGIRFVVGRLKGQSTTTVQTVIFDSEQWSAADARAWLSEHDMKSGKLDETENSLRFRQREPGEFEEGSFRTISPGSRDQAQEYQDGERTGITNGHAHSFDADAERTGEADGHSHPILRNDAGEVTAIGNADGHTHSLPAAADMGQGRKRGKAEAMTYADIAGVEIFRTGKWNGDAYDHKDLDDMVAAFERVGFRPPIKLGHKENSGDPAFGWVKALRRVGDVLLADFMDIPDKIADMIKARQFDAVSSEIFWNLERGGKKFRRALKAVALLGAETPAVAGLKPLRESFDLDGEQFEGIHVYDLEKDTLMSDKDEKPGDGKGGDEHTALIAEKDQQIAELTAKLEQAGKGDEDLALTVKKLAEDNEALKQSVAQANEERRAAQIDAKVDKIRVPSLRDHFRALYDLASRAEVKTVAFASMVEGERKTADTAPAAVIDDLAKRIEKLGDAMLREYAVHGGDPDRPDVPPADNAGAELDRLAKAYQAKHPDKSYGEAFSAVLSDPENVALKRAYAAS